jgi:hypothetical protein
MPLLEPGRKRRRRRRGLVWWLWAVTGAILGVMLMATVGRVI